MLRFNNYKSKQYELKFFKCVSYSTYSTYRLFKVFYRRFKASSGKGLQASRWFKTRTSVVYNTNIGGSKHEHRWFITRILVVQNTNALPFSFGDFPARHS